MRIGFGYDVHKFVKSRKLILGGVKIKYTRGLSGHSDADVLLHAICDSLLGAAGLNDIGFYFPNTDKKWKNISSIILLEECFKMINRKKIKIVNIDCTILLEEPKIKSYIDNMKENICKLVKIKENQISIKSTTSEGLGFIGKKEGCAAFAVCMLG